MSRAMVALDTQFVGTVEIGQLQHYSSIFLAKMLKFCFLVAIARTPYVQVTRYWIPKELRGSSERAPKEPRRSSEGAPKELRRSSDGAPKELRRSTEGAPKELRQSSEGAPKSYLKVTQTEATRKLPEKNRKTEFYS